MRLLNRAAWWAATLLVVSHVGHLARADETRSPREVRALVDGLQKDDVAWREVQWKTCLIDGMNESQKTGKPLMLWIFIDRPIDDERC